jgi:hypothetical protein
MDLSKRLRYVPLLAAGVVVFLGLVFLGGLTGLLWHIRTFVWWVNLSPFVLGPTADWFTWGVSFLFTVSPSVAAVVRRRVTLDPVLMLTSLVFPLVSLATLSVSYFVGATLLVGSGFLITYVLVSRSEPLLDLERSRALRIICAVVFSLLSVMAAGGAFAVLVWGEDFFLALVSGSSLVPMDIPLNMLAVDLELFYLARPILSGLLLSLAVAALVALFREPLSRVAGPLVGRLRGSRVLVEKVAQRTSATRCGSRFAHEEWLPYLVLAGSAALGIGITLYPYVVAGYGGVLGVDSWFYIENLRSMNSLGDAVPLLRTPRTIFIVLLFLVKILTGLGAEPVVRFMPTLLSVLLALSSYALVKEGTGRSWVAAFAAVLSVISAQTALGMAAGIINNWFALSIANFAFALLIRAIRLRSKLAAVGTLAFSLVLLVSYAFLWVVFIAEITLVLGATIVSLRVADHDRWRHEVGLVGGILLGDILIPVALLFVAIPLLGFHPEGLDVSLWFVDAWNTVTQVQPQLLGSVLGVLEEAFDFAGNRIDLPLLTLLSIVGVLDQASQRRGFSKIMAANVIVPVALTLVISASSASPYTPMWLTWRGLYVIPLYATAALGAESIIRRVNDQESPWKNRSQLAFAATFVAYIFLSHLSYSLRALELLIIVGSR